MGSTTKATAEDKAAKIERLKSGFKICKPQGTFLWPNKGMSAWSDKVMVQLEDLFLVPTPSSVSSSTASSSARHLLCPLSKFGPLPTSPIKPLPESGPATVSLTAAVNQPSRPLPLEIDAQFEKNSSTAIITTTTTSSKTSFINLNELPCPPFTYQRRNLNETTTTAISRLGDAKREGELSQREEHERKEILRDCDQKQKGCSSSASSSSSSLCLSMADGTWLALTTPNHPPLDSNPARG